MAAAISTVLPLWESRSHLIAICKNTLTCTTAEASVHAGEFFGDKIGADTSKVSPGIPPQPLLIQALVTMGFAARRLGFAQQLCSKNL